jgi:hypothetical protein
MEENPLEPICALAAFAFPEREDCRVPRNDYLEIGGIRTVGGLVVSAQT